MPTAPPSQAELLQQHLDAVTRLRQGGASWDEVHQYYAAQTGRMRAGGANEDEIRQYYGGTDPAPVAQDINARVQQNAVTSPQKSWVDAFTDGLTNSSAAALLGHASTPDQPGEGTGAAVVHAIGETVGDLPVAIPSAFVAGKAVTAAVARVPGLAEFAPEAGGLFGAFSAAGGPTLVKAERDAWINAGNKGWNAGDFLQQHGLSAQTAGAAAGMGLVGLVTHGVGGVVEQKLAQAGVQGVAKVATKVGTEATTFTAASSAIQGRMPTTEDFVDGAILVAAFHVGGRASASTMRGIRTRLQQQYVETGENPDELAQRAKTDPVLRAQLLGNPHPPTPAGSSRSTVPDHVNRTTASGAPDPGAPPQDQYVIPRVHGDFDSAVNFTLVHEGSPDVIDANGAHVKWGINAKANPGVDVAHLSREQASEIYKHKYWDPIGADQLPPEMRTVAFDTAVVEGVGRAKQWLAESNNDPKIFLGKRAAFEAELAAKDPARYGRFVKAWGNRIRDLGGHDASVGLVSRDPIDPISENERAMLDNGGLPPKPPSEEPPEPSKDQGEPGNEGSLDRVMSRTAPPIEKDWWGDTVQGAMRIYGEMFNPDHPIRGMMASITEGKDVEGFVTRPEALRRLAENSSTLSKYAIEHNMTDLDNNVTGRGLKPIIEDAGDKASQRIFLDGYARSRWAEQMHDRGMKTGIDPNDATKARTDLEAQHPHFSKLFDELQGWRNGTLKWLGESGVHAQSKVDDLIAKGDAAMPGYRRMDDGTLKPNPAPGKGMFNPIKSARGSERLIEPMEQSLMRDAFLRRALADTNRSNAAIADAGMEGNKASERRAVNPNVMQAIDELTANGLDDEDLPTALLKAAGRQVKDDEVPVLRDGKLYGVKFENPEITRVLRGFDSGVRHTAVKLAAAITAVPRTLQTIANPLFAPKMQVYDAWFQHITNPDARNVFKSFTMGVGSMLDKNSGMYDEWIRNGGAERVFTRMSNDQYLKDTFGLRGPEQPGLMDNAWNAAKGVYGGLDAWARIASTPIRLGRYVQGRQAGETPERAAVASTESSLHRPNFGGPLSKVLNSVLPFLTARLNGMEKTGRAMLGGSLPILSGGRLDNTTSTGVPYNAKQFWINGAVAITIPALLTWASFKDQPWYKAMPDWQKDNSIFIIPPTGVTGPIPFPAPPLLGPIFSGTPRRLMEAFAEDNPHAFDNLGPSIFAGLAGPMEFVSASVLQPFVEHMTNFSFMKNQPLVNPDTVRGVGAAEQFTHYSSTVAKGIAQFVNDLPLVSGMKLSPIVIDNYIRYWGGDSGQYALKAVDAVANTMKINKPPADKFSDWPGVSSWQVRYPSASAQPITDFYDRSDAFDQVHGSLKALMKDGNLERFKQIAEQNPSAAAYHLLRFQDEPADVDTSRYMDVLTQASAKADWQDLGLYKQGQSAVKAASIYANKVWEDPKLTPMDKRQILDQTYATLQVISERTNEALDRAESGHAAKGAPAAPNSIEFQPPDARVQ